MRPLFKDIIIKFFPDHFQQSIESVYIMLTLTETLLGKTPFLHAQEERIHCQTLLWCGYSNGWPRSTAGRWSLRSQRRAGFGYPLTDDGFAALAAGRCNKLASLDVSGCAVNDAKLLSIAAGFPELRELTLLQCLSVKQGGGQVLAAVNKSDTSQSTPQSTGNVDLSTRLTTFTSTRPQNGSIH